jgi:endonuclease G
VRGANILRAAGFVLDQSPQLANLDLETVRDQTLLAGTSPPLGPYRTYQVPIGDIAGLTELNLAVLAQADVLAPLPAIRDGTDLRDLWVELTEITVIRL